MNVKIREKIKGKEMKVFVYASAFLLYVAAFLLATPTEIIQGMKTIIWSKDALDFGARFEHRRAGKKVKIKKYRVDMLGYK